jgi:signal transduction histidine kinase
MRFGRLRAFPRTLRFRLTAWTTAVVLVLVSAVLVGVHEGARYTLVSEFDEELREDALEIRFTMKEFYPDRARVYRTLDDKARGHVRERWFVQLFDADGRLRWASPDAPPVGLLPNGGPEPADVPPFRIVRARFDEPGMPPVLLQVGSSREPIDSAISLLTRITLLAGGLAVALTPLGAFWLAGRATRPLGRIIATAARLHPDRLDERLPIRHTGDELDRLSHTINGLLDRIAGHLDQNRDFIANAAHELRSPLTALRTSVEVALDGRRTNEEYAGLLTDVMEECTSLGNLVTRLLVLAEGDAGRIAADAGSARLDDVARKAVAMFQGVAESREVELLAPRLEEVRVSAGEPYLRQVVQNLIDNAVKFTPPRGRVEVQVWRDAATGRAELTVADTGVGIPAEELTLIFDRFYRGDRSRHHETGRRGNGLGLSICRSIVVALAGDIAVESVAGRGSRFRVSLPSRVDG